MKQDFRSIEQLSQNEVLDLINSKPVVLIGSAISNFHPTNLPAGANFINGIFSFIFSDLIRDEDNRSIVQKLEEEYNNMPFEAVMECFPLQKELPSTISNIFRTEAFNEYHRSFADKFERGVIHSIITPNYDLAFDKILDNLNFKKVVFIKQDYELRKQLDTRVYFKIHGTSEQGFSESLVYNLSQESKLEEWKRVLLQEIINKRNLIVIGYSGRDFDICPVIAELNSYNKIIWIHREGDSIMAYQEALIKSKETNEIVYGDLSRFARQVFGEEIVLKFSNAKFESENYFNLNKDELLMWQIHILDRMACANLIYPILCKLKKRIPLELHKQLMCNYYGHIGKYKKAAQLHFSCAKQHAQSTKEHIVFLMYSSGSWIGYGDYFYAYRNLAKAKKLFQKYFKEDLQLQLNILKSELVFWSKVQKLLGPIKEMLKGKVSKIRIEIDKLKQETSLDNRQEIRLNLNRLKISTDFSFISSYKGYNCLGITGMSIIAYRHKIENGEWEDDEEPLADLEKNIEKAKFLGMSTELWKLSRIRLKKRKLSLIEKRRVLHDWKYNLQITEYGLFRFCLERVEWYWFFFKFKLLAK